jgi:putative endonuclease
MTGASGLLLAEDRPAYRAARDLGRRGEAAAALHLEALGWRLLARSFRTSRGEVDLVARDRDVLVFVEVKARSTLACGRPAESVGPIKRARLAAAARAWLLRYGGAEPPCRFDVVEVLERPDGDLDVRHVRDAFQIDA